MSKHSFVEVPADKAKELAEAALVRVEAARHRDVDNFVAARTKELNSKWYRKLFRMKELTLSEVEVLEREGSGWDNEIWEIENLYYSQTEELAGQVLIAVRYGDPVHLSLDDIERLG